MVWYGMVWYGMVWYGMVWYWEFQIFNDSARVGRLSARELAINGHWELNMSDDDFRSGCRKVSQCHLKQPFSGLHSPGRSQFTKLFCYISWKSMLLNNIMENNKFCNSIILFSVQLFYASQPFEENTSPTNVFGSIKRDFFSGFVGWKVTKSTAFFPC